MHIYTQKDVFINDEHIALRKIKQTGKKSLFHTHEFIEFSYTFAGNTTHIINGQTYETERGSALFIPLGYCHKVVESDTDSYVEIYIKSDVIDKFFYEIKEELNIADDDFEENYMPYIFSSFSGEERHRLESLIQDMLTEYNNKDLNFQNVLLSYLRTLITLLVRNRLTTAPKFKGIPIDVINFIDVHYRRSFKIDELATKSFYSPKYFSHVFKKSMGVSLGDYISKKRVDEGARLLIETDMTIDNISKSLGWENDTQFYNNFKKYYGVTPHTYRKEHR